MTTKTIGAETTLSAGYAINSVSGLTLTNLGVLGGTSAAYALQADTTGDAVYNSGKILAAAVFAKGVFANQSVRITNLSGGTISGGYALYLLAGGTVSNASGALITGARPILGENAGVQVRNQGVITGTGTSANQAGIQLKAGGYVYNMAGGSISGANGVYQGVSATVRNAGSIRGNGGAGFAGVALNAGGAVTNASKAGQAAATISSAYTGVISRSKSAYVYNNNAVITGSAVGVSLAAGGTLNNASGTVSGNYDVAVNGAYGFVENDGAINGGKLGVGMSAGGRVINAPTGSIAGTQAVSISGGAGSVYNEGIINAGATGFAVNLPAGFNNILTIAPGAAFTGTVTGGDTVGATNSSQMELEIGTKTGTIGGFGTQFVDFNQIYVRPNANWSITSGSIALGTTFGVQASATLTNQATIAAEVTLLSYYTGSKAGIPGPEVINASGGTIGAGTATSTFGIYNSHPGPSGVVVPADTVVNDGKIIAATGIKLVPAGVVTNQSQGTIAANTPVFFESTGTLINQGFLLSGSNTVIAGVYLGGGGTVVNQGAGAITGPRGVRSPGYVKVENYNFIAAFAGPPLVIEGSTSAARAGVLLGSGFITNGSTAVIKGPQFGIGIGYKTANKGTVVNAGTISAYLSSVSNSAAVYLFNGGLVTNQSGGLITAVGTGNVFGVRFHGTSGGGLGTGTLVNQGSISVPAGFGFYSNAGGAVSNTGTGAITALAPIKILNGTASVDNQGMISGSTSGTADGVLIGYGTVLNEAKGTITASVGISISQGSGSVTNRGVIAGAGVNMGVNLGDGGVVSNTSSAQITGYSGMASYGYTQVVNQGTIRGQSIGVALRHGGAITNSGSGLIAGYTNSAVYVGADPGTVVNSHAINGVVKLNAGGAVTNAAGGTINGGSLGITITGGGQGGSVVNYGAIYGLTAVSIIGAAGTVANYGYIDGSQTVGGVGTVGTAVTLASGFANRLRVGAGAKFLGNIDGGNTVGATATSTLELVSGNAATLTGLGQYFANFGSFVVDPFATWTLAGSGSIASGTRVTDNGLLTNNGKIFTPVTLTNGASLTNASGATVTASIGVYAAATAPSVFLSNSGKIAGGASAGGYGVRFNGGGSVTNFGTIGGAVAFQAQGGAGSLTNYGTIQSPVRLTAGFANRLAVAPRAVFQSTVDGGNTIGAATASTLELLSASSAGTLIPATYTHFSSIVVDQSAVWSLPTGTGVPAGSVVSVSGTLTNNGTVLSPVFLVAGSTFGGALTNATGATISAGEPVTALQVTGGQAVTLTNFGTISGTNTLPVAAGVELSESAQVTNQANALIRGARYGVILSQNSQLHSTITNYGSIIADGTSATAAVELIDLALCTIVNNQNAVISAAGTGSGVDLDITADAVSPVTNHGTISGYRGITGSFASVTNATNGLIKASAQAISVAGSGTILNQAVITSSSSLAVGLGVSSSLTNQSGGTIQGRNGISVGSGGTVVNYGLIAGTEQSGYSVNLAAGAASRLIVHPGATFVGQVNGGNTFGASARSTLELASGASTGTLSGLGSQFTDFSTVLVDPSARWALTGQNSLTAGALLLDNAAALDVAGVFSVDGQLENDASGSIDVSGGRMIVENQGTLTNNSGGLEVGQAASGGAGEIDVTGTKSAIVTTGTSFIVGDDAVGTLNIESGGTVMSVAGVPGLVIANTASASGSSLSLSGTNSTLQVSGALDVGVGGSGELDISAGASVSMGSLDGGISAAGIADVLLTGAGTELVVDGAMTVADDGTGVLSVLNGASLSAQTLTIGNLGDSSGAMVVSGNSTVTVSGELNIGTALGTGDLTVGPGCAVNASVENLEGGVVLEGGLLDPTVFIENGGSTTGGFGTVSSQFILLEGTILSNGSKSGKETEVVEGTILGGGTANIKGSVSVNGPGILQIGTHDTIELTGAVLNSATTTFTDNLTPTGTYSVANSVIDVVFQDSTGVLQLDDIAGFAGTVATWKAGDQFVITGGTLSGIGVSNGDTLTFSDSGSGAGPGGIDSIIFGSAIGAGGFTIVNGDTVQAVACFAEGTRIATRDGRIAVEHLRLGDLALTVDGLEEPIVWIGRRMVNCAAHPRPETVWPVRVRPGAFGAAVPARDLYLSPDHAVFVNDALVPVKLLIDGSSIAQVRWDRVTYFHVELPRHAVIRAEGLAVESYLDAGDRSNFPRDDGAVRLFPDFDARFGPDFGLLWETRGAAPLVMAGETLAAARRAVTGNAVSAMPRVGLPPAFWSVPTGPSARTHP